MTKQMKRIGCVLLCVLLSASFSVCAFGKAMMLDAPSLFEIWTGSGDSSCTLHTHSEDFDAFLKADEFERLLYSSQEVPADSYAVSEKDGYAVITLKEDYLKNFSTGTYYFEAEFKDAIAQMRIHIVPEKITLTEPVVYTVSSENWSAMLSPAEGYAFYPALFESISRNGEALAPDDYTVSGSFDCGFIRFTQNYRESLAGGTYIYDVDYMHVDGVQVKMVIYAPYMPGDCNGDAAITAQDARLALRSAANLETLGEQAKNAACVLSENGAVTAADAREILRVSASLEDVPLAK